LMENQFKAGHRLPSEHELARQFNVGRGTIREAVKALTVVGFLRVEHGKGTFVAERSDFFMGPMSLGFDSSVQLDSLIGARRLIEAELARLAAKQASREDIRAMEACLVSMEQSTKPDNSVEFQRADLEFHFVVAKAADNPLLSGFMTLIRNLLREWISVSLRVPSIAEEALRQHRQIFEAIRDGKAQLAGRVMIRHLEAVAKPLALATRRQLDEERFIQAGSRNSGKG
jgi:GntR family transcriptional repressor for pyruvate dehydrogenase complex